MAAEVFVSYARKDRDQVMPLVEHLQTAGVSVWMDERGIDGALLWGQEIVEAIEECKVLILMVSPLSVASDHVVREVALASEAGKPILPLLLEPIAVPKALRYHLVGIQQIEIFRGRQDEKFHAVLRSLTRFGVEAGEPQTLLSGDGSTREANRPGPSPRDPSEGSSEGGREQPRSRQTAAPPPSAPRARSSEPSAARPISPSGDSARAPAMAARVALLYKRHAQPDEQLLKFLETHLLAHGLAVFIDRHLAIGVEWAKEIERQVRTSDAVIPLLSAASVDSEMLDAEVRIAHDAAQKQGGKPRLLPVRVNHTDPLPESLAGILEPLEYTLWEGPQDNERLAAELISALRNPSAPRCAVPPGKLEPVGGAVPLDSEFYVVRPTDEAFRSAILRQDSIVLVKGARQMGKTSLLARGLQRAREAGARVVITDFQKLNAAHLESPETLFLTLAEWIARQLRLDVLPETVWNPRSGPNINFEWYLRGEVLEKIEAPIVWGLDEVDCLFECDFAREIFGLFRSWHNERALDPSGPWARLTLAIAYATEAHLFITDVNRSPFNVGTRLTLDDFTFEQVADLNRRHGSPLADEPGIARFYRLVGGQPYLVRRGLLEMATQGLDIGALEDQAGRNEGIFGDHLRRILVLLVRDPELCDVVRGVLRSKPCPTPESFYRLRSAGVMTGDSARDVRPRCQLYATYLEQHLL